VGEQLARGRPTEEIVAGMDQTAEGIPTTAAAVAIAESLGVEMPIAQATKRVLAGDLSPQDAINELMSRAPAPETG
jgi:glycerol-3-phosphate dehydrogenase (NAD(P)+)